MNSLSVGRALAPVAVAFFLALSACGGGSDDHSTSCDSLAGDSVTFTAGATCTSCSVTNAAAGADGNFGSYATMTEPVGSTGQVSLRATRSDGGTYAAGTPAGVVFGFDGTTQNGITLSITTYLKGVTQQQQNFESDDNSYTNNTGSFHASVSTTLPFDAVEYNYQRTDSSTVGNARVYELCKS